MCCTMDPQGWMSSLWCGSKCFTMLPITAAGNLMPGSSAVAANSSPSCGLWQDMPTYPTHQPPRPAVGYITSVKSKLLILKIIICIIFNPYKFMFYFTDINKGLKIHNYLHEIQASTVWRHSVYKVSLLEKQL
jgi:hypothetical protein